MNADPPRRPGPGEGRESELMRIVAQSTVDYAIMTLDLQGLVTTWNVGAERIFGHRRDEIIGRSAVELFTPEDRELGAPEREMRQAREHGRAEDERWHLRRDGSRFYCSGIMTPLFEEGALLGYAKIARDLTGSKLAESRREAQLLREVTERANAEAASRLKDEFLAVMTHELKNPLNLINLNAEVLALLPEVRTVPAAMRAADVIRKTVVSQAQIIDDLLDLSRLDTGKLSLKRRPVDLAATIESIVRALADQAAGRGVALRFAGGEPRPVVDADPVRVEQIVWNLLSNALKFTPAGGRIDVELSVEGGFARLAVSDTGCGIDADDLDRVFDLFRQVRYDGHRQRGLGIGLALVRQLAELHGGRADVASEGAGRGSTFRVWLPVREGTSDAAAAGAAADDLLAGLRVLVVDDEADNVEGMLTLLRLAGCDVRTATTAAEALEAVALQSFDLILSDLAMPGMDGFGLIQALRARPATAATPAVALSGFARAVDAQRALRAGYDAHLRKPFSLDQLLRVLSPLRTQRPA